MLLQARYPRPPFPCCTTERTIPAMKIVAALSILALSWQLAAQNTPRERSNFALEKTVVAALSFQQDDLASLNRAHDNFAPKGWDEFIKTMQGFLEPNGAPTF